MGCQIFKKKEVTEYPNWTLISRALNNHDAVTVYTLLCERYSHTVATRALIKLIATVPDWPNSEEWKNRPCIRRLSNRELQVLRCAARGLTALETAQELFCAIGTIKTYRRLAMRKLDAHPMTKAIHRGRELGLIE